MSFVLGIVVGGIIGGLVTLILIMDYDYEDED